ncbi:MAG: hypothetical protein H0U74_21880 [Bradymonadaceae bacterium]|nr:hypothetical protein [Lujinxingiaceae bacterium]
MRKTTQVTLVALVVLAIGGYIFLAQPFNSDRRMVEELSKRFVEDLQFKDFRSSSLYHHRLEQSRVDIGRALERLFMVKPEMLDIIDYRVVRAEIDSTDNRARVLVNARFRRLNMKDEAEEADLMLYWVRRHPHCPIGARCNASGQCHNEYDEVLKKPKDDKKPQGREAELADPSELALSELNYACDASAPLQWFMNLDSTLKEKIYNH